MRRTIKEENGKHGPDYITFLVRIIRIKIMQGVGQSI